MNNRTLIIGLRPEYTYPGTLKEWGESNTLFAANLGANLICQSLIRQFDGTYVDDFRDITRLREQFDRCILAFATHIHPTRDISLFADVIEQLDMPTYFLSGGISDYDLTTVDYSIHPSVRRLLEHVSTASQWIGVRGHYTAHVLRKLGFRNVVPIGCPTLFWNLDGPLTICKKNSCSNALVPYHLTLSRDIPDWLSDKRLLGQDFQDQVIFTSDLESDTELHRWLRNQFASEDAYSQMKDIVCRNGHFERTFDGWFSFVGQHDFVVGPRLHGCIAGLIQGIPSVMTPRDLRVQEIAEFFDIPTIDYNALGSTSLDDLYASVDYDRFNETHAARLRNYLVFLRENGLESRHRDKADGDFCFLKSDIDNIHGYWAETACQAEPVNQPCEKKNSLLRKIRNRIGA